MDGRLANYTSVTTHRQSAQNERRTEEHQANPKGQGRNKESRKRLFGIEGKKSKQRYQG